MLTLNKEKMNQKVNFVPVVNSPEHKVGDEPEEGEEGDVHPPHPQQADRLHSVSSKMSPASLQANEWGCA